MAQYNQTGGFRSIQNVQAQDSQRNTSSLGKSISIGYQAGANNTAARNLFIGYNAGAFVETGQDNLMIGYEAGKNCSFAQNMCVGALAGRDCFGSGNLFVGTGAGATCEGDHNVLIGHGCGANLRGNNNVVIGKNTDTDNANIDTNNDNRIDIIGKIRGASLPDGRYEVCTGDVLRVGDFTLDSRGGVLHLLGDVVCGSLSYTSDARNKSDIVMLQSGDALRKVMALEGCYFTSEQGKRNVGFVAQQVERVVPQVVSTSATGEKSLAYGNLCAVLVEAVKALATRVEALEIMNKVNE
jgi:Chaperone of endosialidase